MIEGSCLCGGVHYKYDGEIQEISMCHCAQCRKAQGTAFVAVGSVESAKFQLVSGSALLKQYRSSPNKIRVFCSNCGSPLYSELDGKPQVKRLRLGTIDTAFTSKNKFHIHAASKAPWHEIIDDYPQYPGAKT